MKLSIAMATFNGGKYIEQQLRSLSSQRLLPAELIISDDGSSDDTLAIAMRFAQHAPFEVRISQNSQRLGFRKNFMLAASLCHSELIAFCDQDDIWHADKLSTCVGLFQRPEITLVYHNSEIINEEGVAIGDLSSLAAPRAVNAPLSFNPWLHGQGFSQIFRRRLLEYQSYWPQSVCQLYPSEPMAHDQWIPFLAATLGSTAYLDRPLASYRQHAANVYGWHGEAGLAARLLRIFTPDIERYSNFSKAALARAGVLAEIANVLHGTDGERARVGLERYRILAERYSDRSKLYSNSTISSRIQTFRRLMANGAYARNDPWAFGRRSLLKDVIIGMAGGKVIAKKLKSRFSQPGRD